MIKNLLFISLTFFKIYTFAQNFAATYGFADITTATGTVDPGIPPTVSGLSLSSFSAVGVSSNPSASGRFSFTNWPLGGINATDDYSNFTGALLPTVYYEVKIAPNPGYTLSLNSVSFGMRRSGTGVRHYCVRSNLDNYINNLAATTGTNTKISVIPGDIFFWNFDSVSTSSDQRGSEMTLGNQFKGITQSITFRIYAWNAESAGGSFSIDNFSLVGSLTNGSVTNPVGLLSQPIKKELKIYPNPNETGVFNIDASDEVFKVEVLSFIGNTVLTIEFKEENTRVDLSELANGVYFVKAYSLTSVSLNKIIVVHK